MPSDTDLLVMTGIAKQFTGVRALEDVNFSLRAGEVHALMGENGAGKSTLIKCLTGVCRPSSGEIRLAGKVVHLGSPREAEGMGIGTVFQEIGLIGHLSIAENVCLGREPVGRFWPRLIRWGE